MLRYGKPVADIIEKQVTGFIADHQFSSKYIAVIMLGEDHPGSAYVANKKKYAERVGIGLKIIGNENKKWTDVDIIHMIQKSAADDNCIGIMVQLPLPIELQPMQQKIIDCIPGHKDIDGLTSFMHEVSEKHPELFVPATPRAVLSMIDYYGYELAEKKIAMLGNSHLIGKPLTETLRQRGAQVRVFTIESDQHEMKEFCRNESDMIISATGHIHLVDEGFVRDDKTQIVIDVGRGYKDGKAVGDVDWQSLEDKVAAITPVPGGVGPVTVASLFANIMTLSENGKSIASLYDE